MKIKYGIANHILAFSSAEELKRAKNILTRIKELEFNRPDNFHWWDRKWVGYKEWHLLKNEIKGFRAKLRKRYAKSMNHGLYIVKRSSIAPFVNVGKWGTRRTYGDFLKKGRVLMWLDRDELDHNWYMIVNKNIVVSIRGADLDGLEKIKVE